MKKYFLIGCFAVFLACGKEAPPSPPGPISLVFPTQNLDCAQGSLVNEVTRRIPFEWREATESESYRLEIIQLSSGQKTTQNTTRGRCLCVMPWSLVKIFLPYG